MPGDSPLGLEALGSELNSLGASPDLPPLQGEPTPIGQCSFKQEVRPEEEGVSGLCQTFIAGSGSPATPLREISTNRGHGEGEELNSRPG